MEAILEYLVPLASSVFGGLVGILSYRFTHIKNKQDAIQILLEQNKELVQEVADLQDRILSLSN